MDNSILNDRPICFFLPSLAGGGAERVLITLANELSSRGTVIDLVIATNQDQTYLHEIDENVKVIQLNCSRTIFSIPPLVNYINSRVPISILTTMAHSNLTGGIARLIAYRRDTKHIIRQAISPGSIKYGNTLTNAIATQILKFIYRRAFCTISVSEDMVPLIENTYKGTSRIETIKNPVNAKKITLLAKQQMELRIPWSEYDLLVVGMGRLSKQKDFATLIRALDLVRESVDAKLIILGEGPERTNLTEDLERFNLKDHVWMPGFIENPFPFILKADVFVLSSIFEGLPNALIQALILGTPCVSTKCVTGPSEILESGKLGSLVDIGDYKEMASTIISGTIKIDQSTKNRLTSIYSVEEIADQYLALLTAS